MQYDKQMIDMYGMIYHPKLNNIYNNIRTNLNIINLFFAHHIPIQSDLKGLEIRKQFYNFKLCLNGFVNLVPFWQSKSTI